MARIISVLALAAVAAAELPRIKNKDGNLVLSVGDGGGKVGVSLQCTHVHMQYEHSCVHMSVGVARNGSCGVKGSR